jgi:hypothetical protein
MREAFFGVALALSGVIAALVAGVHIEERK